MVSSRIGGESLSQTEHITLWPVNPLPMPLVESGPMRLNADGVIEAFEGGGSARSAHPVPDELYLRGLFKLRLENAAAAVGFTERYGPLRAPGIAGVLMAADPDSQGIRDAANRLGLRAIQLREIVLADLAKVKDARASMARKALSRVPTTRRFVTWRRRAGPSRSAFATSRRCASR